MELWIKQWALSFSESIIIEGIRGKGDKSILILQVKVMLHVLLFMVIIEHASHYHACAKQIGVV